MKKILLVLLVVVLILSACKVPAETQDSTQAPELSAEIQVTSKLLRVSGRSEDEMISDMKTLGENLQKDVFLNDDGIVTVRFAETERWQAVRKICPSVTPESSEETTSSCLQMISIHLIFMRLEKWTSQG